MKMIRAAEGGRMEREGVTWVVQIIRARSAVCILLMFLLHSRNTMRGEEGRAAGSLIRICRMWRADRGASCSGKFHRSGPFDLQHPAGDGKKPAEDSSAPDRTRHDEAGSGEGIAALLLPVTPRRRSTQVKQHDGRLVEEILKTPNTQEAGREPWFHWKPASWRSHSAGQLMSDEAEGRQSRRLMAPPTG